MSEKIKTAQLVFSYFDCELSCLAFKQRTLYQELQQTDTLMVSDTLLTTRAAC